MGQFCLGACKRQPYDTDLRIPALIVGPGIAAGTTLPFVAGIPDLAPTFLDLAMRSAAGSASGPASALAAAGAVEARLRSTGLAMDGRSMAPHLLAPGAAHSWRDAYLVEYYAVTSTAAGDVSTHLKDNANNTFVGLRVLNTSMNLAYFEFTDAVNDWGFRRTDKFCELYDLAGKTTASTQDPFVCVL